MGSGLLLAVVVNRALVKALPTVLLVLPSSISLTRHSYCSFLIALYSRRDPTMVIHTKHQHIIAGTFSELLTDNRARRNYLLITAYAVPNYLLITAYAVPNYLP